MRQPGHHDAAVNHYLWDLRPYLRQVSGELVLGSICGVLMNTLVVLPAILLGRAIDVILAFGKGRATAHDVALSALAFAGGTLAIQLPRFAKRWWLMTANARIRANLRADALRGVLAWPLARVHGVAVGDLMARMVADVEVVGAGMREFTVEIWDTLLFSLSLLCALFAYDAHLTLLVLLPVPIAMLLAFATGRWVRRRTTRAREANAALTATLQEQLAGIRVLKLFGRTGASVARVAAQAQALAEANLAVVRLREGLKPLYSGLMVAGSLFVVLAGGSRVLAGAMTVGAFVAYLELFLRFANRGHRVPQMINTIHAGAAAYARVSPLLAAPLKTRHDPPQASFTPGYVTGSRDPLPTPTVPAHAAAGLRFDRVTFRYPGANAPALQQVSLDIRPGAFVAVTGPVGCGKSALLRAALGLYPLEAGEILLDDRPLAQVPAAARTSRIGYLPQEPSLFSGSIRENVAFSSQPAAETDARLAAAACTAQLEDDLRAFPAGWQTAIGELGIRVSGGQRQRIALARSLAATPGQPALLVLDDPFSAVDLDTEAKLIAALRATFGPGAPRAQRATILLSSHRLAAFAQADHIVVLDHGHVVETGTHGALMAADGLYARIFRVQAHMAAGARSGGAA